MHGLAVAGGAGAGLCWLPWGLEPLLPLAFAAAMIGLGGARTRGDAVRFGLLHGAARYAVASHFLLALVAWSSLGYLIYVLAILYILPFAVVEGLGAYWLGERTGFPRALFFGFLYALTEKVRTMGDLSFPADLLSHAFGTHTAWLAWEPWIGPFGQTLLVVLSGWLLALAWERRGEWRRAALTAAGAAVLWLGPVVTAALSTESSGGGAELRVGIVQPAVTLDDKLERERWPAMRAKLERMTMEVAAGVDLVVWPESARAGRLNLRDSEPTADPKMEALAARAGVPILYGCEIARFRDEKVVALYNGAALVLPGQRGVQWYAKQHLLPLVERVPFATSFGWDPSKRHAEQGRHGYLTLMGNFHAGEKPTLFQVGPARIGVMICYEGFYPALARRYRNEGANVLAVLTNDAWWGRSVFARWHAGMISSRAREMDVPVIRAANSGVSCAVDANGRTRDATDLFDVRTVRTVVRPATSPPTFYSRTGDWPVGMILAFFAVALVRGGRVVRSASRARGAAFEGASGDDSPSR